MDQPHPATGPTLCSIGHGARAIEEFVGLLQEAGVRRLVDVRTAPGSRKHPQFGLAALSSSLAAEDIEYDWVKQLGGWRKARPDSPHLALRSRGFRGYADHMQTDEFDAALSWLIDAARTSPSAIMCAESMWWRCHRRLLSDALVARGCPVFHVMGATRQQPHRLHPAARIEGGSLIYDRQSQGPQAMTARSWRWATGGSRGS